MTTSIQRLANCEVLFEGAFWCGWWGVSTYFTAQSLYELYTTFSTGGAASEEWAKIGLVFKTALIDVLSFFSSMLYTARWADEAKVFCMGVSQVLLERLCYVSSAVIYTIQAGSDFYEAWTQGDAILRERSPARGEVHKQRFCLSLMRLISNVTMLAWAILGVAKVAGVVIAPALMGGLLFVGAVCATAAIFYKIHLDGQTPSYG